MGSLYEWLLSSSPSHHSNHNDDVVNKRLRFDNINSLTSNHNCCNEDNQVPTTSTFAIQNSIPTIPSPQIGADSR